MVGGGDNVGIGLHFVEADGAANDHLGGDEGVGGGCVQADNVGGEGCSWVLWPGWRSSCWPE